MSSNLREFSRVHLPLSAAVHSDETLVASGEVSNLSLNGVLVPNRGGASLAAGAPVHVAFYRDEEEPWLNAEGQIVRCDPDWLAIRLNEMGLEDLQRMRNLIRWYSENVELVEQEFDDHLGLRKKS